MRRSKMSYRRRHRWFRRMALGLAFATAVFAGRVSVAAAKFDESGSSQAQIQSTVVQGEDAKSKVAASTGSDPYLTDVFVRPGESIGAPDGITTLSTGSARPDDRADRFSHVDAVPQPVLAGDGWTYEWDDALMIGIGAFVLVLGLGLALGYLRRPRLAGL
jgi:hypothetical protein